MKEFKIHNFLDTYEPRSSSEFGRIYVELGDYAFPGKGWTDFGTQIVFWWMQAFIKLLSEEEKKIRCNFMDGNYRFDVEATDSPQKLCIYFVKERADSDELLHQGEVDLQQITEELLQAVSLVQKRFEEKNNFPAVNRVEQLKDDFLRKREISFARAS